MNTITITIITRILFLVVVVVVVPFIITNHKLNASSVVMIGFSFCCCSSNYNIRYDILLPPTIFDRGIVRVVVLLLLFLFLFEDETTEQRLLLLLHATGSGQIPLHRLSRRLHLCRRHCVVSRYAKTLRSIRW